MAILDSAVHDFDIVRWILGEDFSSIQVIRPRTNSRAVETIDPLLMILRTTGETVVTVETSVNIAYGYDIRAEVVGETGTAALGEHTPVMIRSEGRGGFDVPEDWRVRFSDAFDKELADWVSSAISGQSAVGPSAWDGLAAALVSTAGVASLTSGRPEPIVMPQKPELYA
jgi:myo-inositol 2-dehydrogenase/D-chiro-inositol 1-dehydrogenase